MVGTFALVARGCVPWLALCWSCGPGPDKVTSVSSSTPPDASPSDAAAARPAVDLGPTLEPVPFVSGRNAVAIQRSTTGVHAAQVVSEESTASMVLSLTAGGVAVVCRGWRSDLSNDGPEVQNQSHALVQQGYRGTYRAGNGVIAVELNLDDAVCAPRVVFRAFEPAPVALRCVRARPPGGSPLAADVLVCQWQGAGAPTGVPVNLMVPGLAPPGWFVLAAGDGGRIKVTGKPVDDMQGEPTRVEVSPAPAPIEHDAWEHPS